MAMERIILLQVPQKEAAIIKRLAGGKKIAVTVIDKVNHKMPLSDLLAQPKGTQASNGESTASEGDAPRMENTKSGEASVVTGSLMLLCELSEKHMNKLLFELRSKKVHVDYKAVLTPVNRQWSLGKLYQELAEHSL